MNKFKLQSTFKPAGDQAHAIKHLVAGIKGGKKFQTLLGVTGSGKTFTMANVVEKIQKPTLIISHNKTLTAQLASEFQEFFPENAVHYFVSYYDYYQPEAYIPRSDTYIEKETDINEEIDRLRNAATAALLSRKDVLIVASVSCIYGLGNPADYLNLSFSLKVGKKYQRDKFLRRVIDLQYSRNDLDLRRGNFRVRGDIVEIIPASEHRVLRLDFFADELEKITEFDALTGENETEHKKYQLFPAKHFLTPQDKIVEATENIRKELRLRTKYFKSRGKLLEAQRIEERTNYDLEMMLQAGYVNGIENYSRHLEFREKGEPPSTLIDYFPDDFLMFIDESHMTVPQIGGMYEGDHSRKQNLIDYGFRLPSAIDNRPLKFAEFSKKINNVIYVSATPAPYELEKSDQIVEQLIRPTGLLDPAIEIRPTKHQVDDLLEEVQDRIKKGQRVLATTLTKKMAEELSEYLHELGIKSQYLHSDVDTFERLEILRDLRLGVYDVIVGINLLREGLDLPEVSLVAILDADKEGFLRSKTALLQVMGRASRHIDGKVIMYGDRITGSMRAAIDESERRKKVQEKYNKSHKITPKSIEKAVSESRLAGAKKAEEKKQEFDVSKLDKKEVKHYAEELKDQMDLAAANQEFEKAANFRDQISEIKKSQRRTKHKI